MPTSWRATAIVAAQVLLTLDDTEERRRYLNARATLKTLLELGSVPVINENDTVATAEIRFGDNDRLAARVASMMEADRLILLSDVDGLYSADPSREEDARHIDEVRAITPEIEAMAGGAVSGVGRGGMASKLIAAKIATAAGCEVVIAKGKSANPIAALRAGARATRFRASTTPAAARKRWIAGVLKPQGTLIIDDGRGARRWPSGKSLLPAGIRQVDGRFERGDAVVVRDGDGREIARGLGGLWRGRRRTHRRQAQPRNRGHSRLSWPRRDDPSRRSGVDRDWPKMSLHEAANEPLAAEMCVLGIAARSAARALRETTAEAKNTALMAAAAAIRAQRRGHPGRQRRGHDAGESGRLERRRCSTAWRSTKSAWKRWPRAWKRWRRCPIRWAANWRAGRGRTGSKSRASPRPSA